MKTLLRLAAVTVLLTATFSGPLSHPASAACDPHEAGNQCMDYMVACANACVAACASQGQWPDPHPSCSFDGEGCFVGGSCDCRCFGPY
jgi:hypothetical protein